MAAKVRVNHYEARPEGLRAAHNSAALQDWSRDCEWPARVVAWRDWLSRAMVQVLTEASRAAAERGVTPVALEADLARHAPQPWPREVAEQIRRAFQRAATARLRSLGPGWLERRARAKLCMTLH